jgi:hypothetical protein
MPQNPMHSNAAELRPSGRLNIQTAVETTQDPKDTKS